MLGLSKHLEIETGYAKYSTSFNQRPSLVKTMDTAILETAYELNCSLPGAPLEEMFTETCTMCYHPAHILYPPTFALQEYLIEVGYVGEIMLCLDCIRDTDNWNLDKWE